jgi:hypothetical protein
MVQFSLVQNLQNFVENMGLLWGLSSNYYPQGNGLAESTNKTLIQILKKTIDKNQKNWHLKLTDALWASKMTLKDSTGMSLYMLVYGKEEKMPISLELNALTCVVNTEDAVETILCFHAFLPHSIFPTSLLHLFSLFYTSPYSLFLLSLLFSLSGYYT